MSNDPVVEVSWYGAKAFCDYYGYRLPTEAEWEYTARGGLSGKRFPWGNTISHTLANYNSYVSYPYDDSSTSGYHPDFFDDVSPLTSPVGYFAANNLGLHDVAGNVWEWCNDWYDSGYYNISQQHDPQGPVSGSVRVLRGGCWYDHAHDCRSANRYGYPPDDPSFDYGFRCAVNFQ